MSSEINHNVAEQLYEIAALLEQQQANPFRVNAYRQAAATVERLDRSVADILEAEGMDGLIALPHIGSGIARAIYEIVARGRSSRLESLRGSLDPERLFQTIPGVGPELAERIHDRLHVDTLESLEMAAHNGRLEEVPGVGRRRAAAIRAALSSMLGSRVRSPARPSGPQPEVAVILGVDREYREKAQAAKLPTIAPRRFNPEGEAWLPVLHTDRDGWHFTALYSNTARAHELGRTGDWVVIYYYDDHHQEDQCTVVTESRGALAGRRVVRGRERECRAFYQTESASA